jgi:glucose/arabinose dehydrogenase/cytochrome c2
MSNRKILMAIAACVCAGLGSLARAQGGRGDASRGATLFSENCALCHSGEGAGGQGPNLRGVFGRKAGSTVFGYSAAMKKAGWSWDAARLDRYLQHPQETAPGTAMAYSVPDKKDRLDIIAHLKTLKPVAASDAAEAPGSADSGGSIFRDWQQDRPGLRHKIGIADLPPPYETRSAGNPPRETDRPAGAKPKAPEGFTVSLFAERLDAPRQMRAAPNGDLFVAETAPGRLRVLRPGKPGSPAAENEVYASGLSGPFGIAFYPQGPDPKWLYVAETNRVIRYPYVVGDLKPRGSAEIAVPQLASSRGGHITRDIAFSKDGALMYVSVGSGSNGAQGMPGKTPEEIKAWEEKKGLGAAWGFEENRADVLVFTPEGKDGRIFATGIRNCVGLAIHPQSGDVYCSANERDGLGDNLVPDYVTRIRDGQFYGWPWWYMGNHEDPRWKNARPDLAGKTGNPDVPIQPHSAPLGMTFYNGTAFPAEYRGSAFVAFHGSWNRALRTGYKVVRILMRDGVPTGEYEDFLTGFVIDNNRVWGRPVGVAEGTDGALYVSEDSNGTVWRVSAQ